MKWDFKILISIYSIIKFAKLGHFWYFELFIALLSSWVLIDNIFY